MDPGFEGKARLYSTYSPRTTDTKFLKQKSSNYLFDNYTSINISNRLAFELPEKRRSALEHTKSFLEWPECNSRRVPRGPRKRKLTRTLVGRTECSIPRLACSVSGITIPRVLVAVRVGSGKLPNWIHIHAWFICLLLWLRWSGLSLSAWQSHRRFISVSVGVGKEGAN